MQNTREKRLLRGILLCNFFYTALYASMVVCQLKLPANAFIKQQQAFQLKSAF